jgi:hypothetical protein
MKKFYFVTAIAILLCNSLFSQWAPIGAKWTYTELLNMTTGVDTFTIRSISDTVIQSQQCKILMESAGNCTEQSRTEYMYSDNGKVFFYDASRNSFQMLYNFNANIGDSSVVYPDSPSYHDSIISVVDSVKTIIINSNTLKKLYVHRIATPGWVAGNGIIIENIGDLGYMYYWYSGVCDATWVGPLRCYEDTVIGACKFDTIYSCDYVTVGINEYKDVPEIIVYPNPASNLINVETKFGSTFYYSIYNIYGKLVNTGILEAKLSTIPVSDFSNGVYTIVMNTGNKAIIKRFIVEH